MCVSGGGALQDTSPHATMEPFFANSAPKYQPKFPKSNIPR